MRGICNGGVGGGLVKRELRDAYRTIKASEKFNGWWVGGWWAEIKYSVCPHPLKRPREA